MERLTKRNEDGSVSSAINCPADCKYFTCSMEEGPVCHHECEADYMYKLAEYEDAEEQGLLLKLPCNLGDIVYVIGSLSEFGVTEEIKLEVFECVVNKITLNYKYGNTMQMDCKEHSSFGWSMNMKKFNELVFLTKEEAEQKLKELQG